MIKIYDGFSKDKSYFLSSNGFGYLLEAFSASIILNLNAEFEFTFNYPINGINAKYIKNYNVVKSNMYGMDEQVFRINNVETVISEDGNYYIVSAAHITYDLNNNFLDDVYVKDKNGLNAMKWISEKAVDVHMFNLTSDLQKVSSARYIDKNIIEAIAGDIENSMKNRWGGDIYRDNFDLKLLENLGEDRGYKIIYSKNLRGLNCVIETYDICTRIKAKGFDGITLPEKYIESPLINNYPNPVTRVFEFEDIKINLEPEGDEELVTQELAFTRLREAAKNKFNVENVDKPLISIEVEFEELSTIEEYKKYKILETLFLGDYVTVIVPDMNNFEVKKRVIGIEYDPLNEKIIKLTIGDNIENFIESVNSSVEKVQNKVEKLPENLKETTVNYVSDLLINALGGYVTKTRSELYITDNENLNAALNCWRWNINGLGFSKTGVNGKYETAITGDGRIIADFITAGTMNIDRITGLASELSNLHSTIEINNENITAIISKSGGSNLLENSSGQFGNKKWYDVVTNEAAKIQAFTDTAIKNTFVA
ncbi:MAG: phage tail spike protein, partial [Clostridia bacterium]